MYLKEYNLINDLEFAESFAKDKINLNGFGPKRIKYDLYKKGISNDIIQKVLEEDKDDEYSRALELGKKKLTSYKNDDKNDDKVEFIDDIDGLSEVLENKNSFKKFAREEYPGLIRINKKFKNK